MSGLSVIWYLSLHLIIGRWEEKRMMFLLYWVKRSFKSNICWLPIVFLSYFVRSNKTQPFFLKSCLEAEIQHDKTWESTLAGNVFCNHYPSLNRPIWGVSWGWVGLRFQFFWKWLTNEWLTIIKRIHEVWMPRTKLNEWQRRQLTLSQQKKI